MKSFKVKFLGVEDDGLAARHTGGTGALGGNALEALQMFETAMHIERKYFPEACHIKQRILNTGDEDMIRVPSETELETCISGNEVEKAAEKVIRIAEGAALLTGCRVVVL